MSTTGRVMLCSYGTGNLDLLTIRTVRVLARAGLVLAPETAPPGLRDLASPRAEWRRLGRDQMIERDPTLIGAITDCLAAGEDVVRLLPDDPMLHPLGSAEARWLARCRLPYEIVPGPSRVVTAAGYAGISLAVDGLTSGADAPLSLDGLNASAFNTLSGRSGLLVEDAALPSQRVSQVTIDETTPRHGVFFPGLDEARPRRNWFERLPLFGRRVLVTRGRDQAATLSERLRELGAEPVELPAIEIRPPDDRSGLDQAVQSISSYDWVIFTSVNGIEAVFARLEALNLDARIFGGVRIAAIGRATAVCLRGHGLRADFLPQRFVAEDVLAGLLDQGAAGKRFLLPRAAEARDLLPEGLRAAGAVVDVVAAYRTVPAEPPAGALGRLRAGEIDVLTFTSSSTVRNLFGLVGGDLALLNRSFVACIGPITAGTAREVGLRVDLVADEFSVPGLVGALATTFGGSQP